LLQYLTMICDMKNSKSIKNREEAQNQLIQTLKEVNQMFSKELASSFIITIGDEWQGLLRYPCDYNVILSFFHQRLSNIDFYCGIGIGEISIHNFELTVNQLDGPSFHLARKALKIAKEANHSVVLIQ
jgi:hypothetical protein